MTHSLGMIRKPCKRDVDLASNSAHTHTRAFNGPLSGTTRVSRYQKGKTNLDFTEARDSELQWHQLGHMQVCTSLQTDNHASTPLLSFFTGRMPFLPPNQQRQSTEGLWLTSPDNRVWATFTFFTCVKTSLALVIARDVVCAVILLLVISVPFRLRTTENRIVPNVMVVIVILLDFRMPSGFAYNGPIWRRSLSCLTSAVWGWWWRQWRHGGVAGALIDR